MNLSSCRNLDELNPRAAPIPVSFSSAPISSTVPEVSLIFSHSPMSRGKNALFKNDESHRHHTLSKNSETLPSNLCKQSQDGRLQEKSKGGTSSIVSPINFIPSKVCRNPTLVQEALRDLDTSMSPTAKQFPGIGVQEYLNTTAFHDTQGGKYSSNYTRISSQNKHTPEARDGLDRAFDIRVNCATALCQEHSSHSCQKLDRRSPEHSQSRSTISCPIYGKHMTNHNNHTKEEGRTVNNDPVCNPCLNNHFPYHNSQYNVIEQPCSSKKYSDIHGKCRNRCSAYSCEYTDSVNIPRQCYKCNQHLLEKNVGVNGRKCNHFDQEMITTNNFSGTKLNDHIVNENHAYPGFSERRVQNVTINTKAENSTHKTDLCTVGLQTEFQAEQNDDNSLRVSSNDNEKYKSNRTSSDTSILQEIALMNQKQCSILQGLLQQVVVMQADQMNILSKINEKLSHIQISENSSPLKKDEVSCTSKELPRMENATTQTCVEEENGDSSCCQCRRKCVKDVLSSKTNSIKNVSSSPICEADLKTQSYVELEKDQNKPKKPQDRAVSWSGIHGIETVEESFTLHGVCVPTVVDQLPSSVHTMHLHVQDYHSSASFDSIIESKSVSDTKCCENGKDNLKGSWTLYDNIVGHVQKFLQTVPCEKNDNLSQKTSPVEAIRFATIEKIRQLGVSVYENSTEINTTGRINFDSKVASLSSCHDPLPGMEKSNSDASLELQTLAIKYLRDDDLCDLAKWNKNCKVTSGMKHSQMPVNLSLATQHYLEKYHLLSPGTERKDKRPCNTNSGEVYLDNNILDITTLKKQPKLL